MSLLINVGITMAVFDYKINTNGNLHQSTTACMQWGMKCESYNGWIEYNYGVAKLMSNSLWPAIIPTLQLLWKHCSSYSGQDLNAATINIVVVSVAIIYGRVVCWKTWTADHAWDRVINHDLMISCMCTFHVYYYTMLIQCHLYSYI